MTLMVMEVIISLVGVLLSIAFFTLVERKIMGLMHYRKGPNKVILAGVSQPITDATKLLTKENPKLSNSKLMMYLSGPAVGLVIMMTCWGLYDPLFGAVSGPLKLLAILSVMSLGVYSLMLMSWGSNSKFALLGGYRSIAQVISYEVCFILFILIMVYLTGSYSMSKLNLMQQNYWFALFSLPLLFSWMTLCLAETNRTPFDLSEGESELVSGFNIEYGSGLFALIFIKEYGMILLLSFLSGLIMLGASALLLKTLMFSMIFIWARCSFPRMRWDSLMMTSWKILLPYTLMGLMVMTLM